MRLRGRRILVTGGQGFVGGHLQPILEREGATVIAPPRVVPGGFDIRSAASVLQIITASAPDLVVHLAGITYLPEVVADTPEAEAVNVGGARNLLDALVARAPKARVLMVSSCAVYGDPKPSELPLKESAPLAAEHPYGKQKIEMERLSLAAKARHGLDVVLARPFNHIGRGQDRRISLHHFARQIVAIERGLAPPLLRTGNLDARRDFLDVADVIAAYLALLVHDAPPEIVNVASGQSRRIGEMLEMLLRAARLKVKLETDPSRLRAIDVPELVGDATLLRQATGWEPKRDLLQSLADILDDARSEPVSA